MRWSYSADRALRRCQRLYAFEYVIAWHNAKDELRQKAFRLKQLQSIPLWKGSLIHAVLATELPKVLTSNDIIEPLKLTNVAMELARRQIAFSQAKEYLKITKSNAGEDYCALAVHHNGQEISEEELEVEIRDCFEFLAKQDELLALIQIGSEQKFEKWARYKFDDVQVSARLDLIFISSKGEPVILDWKISKSKTSDYRPQLSLYGYCAYRAGFLLERVPERINLYEVNLLRGAIRSHIMTTIDHVRAEDTIYRSIADMQELVGDGKFDSLKLDELEVAKQPGTCALCKYPTLCIESLMNIQQVNKAELVQGRLL